MNDSRVILTCEHKIYRNYLCIKCKKFVCLKCPCFRNKGQGECKTIIIKDFLEILKKKVEKKIQKLERVKNQYDSKKTEYLISMLAETKKYITKEAGQLIGTLQGDITKEQEKYNANIDDIIKKIEGFNEESKEDKNTLTSEIEDLEKLIESLNRTTTTFGSKNATKESMDLGKAEIIKGYKNYQDICKNVIEFNYLRLRDFELQAEKAREPEFIKSGREFTSKMKEGTKDKADYLYSLVPNSKFVIFFDVHKNGGIIKQIATGNKILPVESGVTSDKEFIYVVGGTTNFTKPCDSAFKINVNGASVIELKRLNKARYENALAKLSNVLICIGGQGEREYLDSIEVVDITEDGKWSFGPKLPFGLSLCSTTTITNIDNPVVFIYGGIFEQDGALKISNLLFRFCLENKEIDVIEVQNAPNLHSAGMINTSSDPRNFSIMIFGGCNSLEEEAISDNVYILTEGGAVKHNRKLEVKDSFFCGSIITIDDTSVYAMGNSMVHRYYKDIWEVVSDNHWLSL